MEVIKFIQIEPNELKSLLKESVKQELNQLKEEILCKTLTSYGIQGRVYYKRDEVERAFIELKQK